MLLEQKVLVHWNAKNKNWYIQKGYRFTETGDSFLADPDDLTDGCDKIVQVRCDYCNETVFEQRYVDYRNKLKGTIPKTACRACRGLKTKESNLLRYGVENVSQMKSVKEKKEATSLKNYGAKHPMQNKEYQDAYIRKIEEKYGTDNVSKVEEFQQKKSRKSIERYGTKWVLTAPEVQHKIQKTLLKKYGVPHNLMSPEIRKKATATIKERYGAENAFQSEEIKEKIKALNLEKHKVAYYSQSPGYREQVKQTCLRRYGVESPNQHPAFLARKRATNLKKYGFPSPAQAEIVKEKMRKTMLETYGVAYISQTPEFWERYRKTCLFRYGKEHPMQHPEIRERAMKTLLKNGQFSTSKQQKLIHDLVGGSLNFLIGYYPVDIAFPEERIYLEYDGGGHDLQVKTGTMTKSQFKVRERVRYYFLKQRGWKEIRIVCPADALPAHGEIIKCVEKAKTFLNDGHNWVQIDWKKEQEIAFKTKGAQ